MVKKIFVMGFILSFSLAIAEVKGGANVKASDKSDKGVNNSKGGDSKDSGIDPRNLLVNCSIDYVMDEKSGLEESHFIEPQNCGLLISNKMSGCTTDEKAEGDAAGACSFQVARTSPLALPPAKKPLLPVSKDLMCKPFIETFVSQAATVKKGKIIPPKVVKYPFPRMEFDCGGKAVGAACTAKNALRAVVSHRFFCKRR